MISLVTLASMNTPRVVAFAPYDYICDGQDDACTIDAEQMLYLRHIMSRVPSVHVDDQDGAGDARTRWASRVEDGRYLFVEICDLPDGRHYVTSFVDDLDYLRAYIEIED